MNNPLQADHFVQKVTVRTAVNASLWACAVISLPLFYFSMTTEGWLQVAFLVIGFIPVASFVLSYLYLLFTNPDYLRSEEYQLRAQSLKLLGDRDNMLGAKAIDVVSVTNPASNKPTSQEENE